MANPEPTWDGTVAALVTICEDLKTVNSDALQLLDKLLLQVEIVRKNASFARDTVVTVTKTVAPLTSALYLFPSFGMKANLITTVLVNVLAGVGVLSPSIYEDLKSDGFVVALQELIDEQKMKLKEVEVLWGIPLGDGFEWMSEEISVRGGKSSDVKKSTFVRVLFSIKEKLFEFFKDYTKELTNSHCKTAVERTKFSSKLLLCLKRMRDGCKRQQDHLELLLRDLESVCAQEDMNGNHAQIEDFDEESSEGSFDGEQLEEELTAEGTDNNLPAAIAKSAAKLIRFGLDNVEDRSATMSKVTEALLAGKDHGTVLADLCDEQGWKSKFDLVSSTTGRVVVKGCVTITSSV